MPQAIQAAVAELNGLAGGDESAGSAVGCDGVSLPLLLTIPDEPTVLALSASPMAVLIQALCERGRAYQCVRALHACYLDPCLAPYEVIWLTVQATGLAAQPEQTLQLLHAVLLSTPLPSWASPARSLALLRLGMLRALPIADCESEAARDLVSAIEQLYGRDVVDAARPEGAASHQLQFDLQRLRDEMSSRAHTRAHMVAAAPHSGRSRTSARAWRPAAESAAHAESVAHPKVHVAGDAAGAAVQLPSTAMHIPFTLPADAAERFGALFPPTARDAVARYASLLCSHSKRGPLQCACAVVATSVTLGVALAALARLARWLLLWFRSARERGQGKITAHLAHAVQAIFAIMRLLVPG